jgi:hypothetical protein
MQARALIEAFRLRRFQPQRCKHWRAALNAQPGLLDRFAVMRLRGFPFGAPKRLRHPDEIVALGLGNQTREREQLATLVLGEAREVRAIRFDRSKYSQRCTQVVI